MKKNKNEMMRIQSLIENDRMNTGDNFTALILSDLKNLLEDYFDFKGSPKLEMEKCGGGYKVTVTITALRIRAFGILPKQQ